MEEPRLVNLTEMNDTQLEQLAAIHRSVMHTLLSDLGLPIILKYYQAARSDLSVVGICAIGPSNEIMGWAMGSPDPAGVNAKVRQPLSWFLPQMLQLLVKHPLVFKQLITSALSSSTEMERNSRAIELTYIAVAPTYLGTGLGRRLLNTYIEQCRLKGYHSVVLSVEEENKSAIALYEKAGFKVIRIFTEGRYRRHRMELILA